MGKVTKGFEKTLKSITKPIEKEIGKATKAVKQAVTDPTEFASGLVDEVTGAPESIAEGTGEILEQARKDIEQFGETTGISDTLLQARDVGAELINVLDVADGMESPSEKKAKEQARADAQALAEAEAEQERKEGLEAQIAKDRAKLEQEKLGGDVDPTGVGLEDVRIIGAGTAEDEEDEILRSLKKFGG